VSATGIGAPSSTRDCTRAKSPVRLPPSTASHAIALATVPPARSSAATRSSVSGTAAVTARALRCRIVCRAIGPPTTTVKTAPQPIATPRATRRRPRRRRSTRAGRRARRVVDCRRAEHPRAGCAPRAEAAPARTGVRDR
jgi:hypothetical protein